MRSTRQQARFAGLLYLMLGLTAPIGLVYVPGQLIVRGDAVATAERIRSSEWLLRLGIASELIHQVIAVFLVLALYRLFSPVDQTHARLLVIFGALLSVPIMFVNVLNEVATLTLIGEAGFLDVFSRAERDALAYLFLRLHGQGISVASVFWGLWLFPFGLLVIRSGFIPAWLGWLLLIAGAGYLATSFTTLVLPQHAAFVESVASPLQFAEVPIIFWLLIRGARPGTDSS
ncbi:DUF4386 domain-containing protein [Piscinibacter sakaiensis]|uniref:DUF4386 domain-containing protein n=1 Tax=Piscinibacter sakaiensis TaxID=1547922 RepID=UPI003AAF2B48